MIILFLSLSSSSDDDEDDDDGKSVKSPPLAIWNNLVSLNNHLNVKLYVFLCGLSTNLTIFGMMLKITVPRADKTKKNV